jgi:hypothetical protein
VRRRAQDVPAAGWSAILSSWYLGLGCGEGDAPGGTDELREGWAFRSAAHQSCSLWAELRQRIPHLPAG